MLEELMASSGALHSDFLFEFRSWLYIVLKEVDVQKSQISVDVTVILVSFVCGVSMMMMIFQQKLHCITSRSSPCFVAFSTTPAVYMTISGA